ncbi:MAG: T9SS type A sorting domain-containing protein, partial [Bacteroidota bacterium]
LQGASFDAYTGTLGIPTPCDPPPSIIGSRVYPSAPAKNKARNGASSAIQNKINIYPNPATGIFYVEVNAAAPLLQWSVKDLFGRELKTGVTETSKTEINLVGFPSGIYYFEGTANGKKWVEKLVKQ